MPKNRGARGQHYIPQLLLRGFASQRSGAEFYTFRFPKKGSPHEANERDVAKNRDFHGNPEESNLEEVISQTEGEFGEVVMKWRNQSTPYADPQLASQFVVHIGIRTKHLRDGAAESFDALVGVIADHAFTGKKSSRKIRNLAVKKVKQELDVRGLLSRLKSRYGGYWEQVLDHHVQQMMSSPDVVGGMQSLLDTLRHNVDGTEIAAAGHRKALNSAPVPKVRSDILGRLNWTVTTASNADYVLGNLGPVIYDKNGKSGPLLSFAASETIIVQLPIAHNRCLTGTLNEHLAIPSAIELNNTSAELSREFFVAAQLTSRELAYVPGIGNRCALVTEEMQRWFA